MKIGATVLQGSWDSFLGTEMVLEQRTSTRAEIDASASLSDNAREEDAKLVLSPVADAAASQRGSPASTAQRRIDFVPVREAVPSAAAMPLTQRSADTSEMS